MPKSQTDDRRADPIAEQSSRPANRAHRAPHARRRTAPLPAHVTRAIRPSPARAEPHDATAWFPVPDPHALPSIDTLLVVDDPDPSFDVVALEALVSPTPARAEPHDAAAWLPLPGDLDDLPHVTELIAPSPEVQAAALAHAETVAARSMATLEAAVAPSPARAVPHTAAAWLPLPDPHTLAPLTELAPADDGSTTRPRGLRRVGAGLWRPRSAVLLALVAATAFALLRSTGDPVPRAVAGVAPFSVTVDLDGRVETVRTTARGAAALGRQLDIGKYVAVREAPRRLGDGSRVVYRTRKSGLLQVDNQTLSFDSPSHTVAELLAVYDISLEGEDTTVPAPDAVLDDGARVKVVRVGAATQQTYEPIPFGEETIADSSIPIGETRLITPGREGVATVTWRARIENGVEVGRTMLSKVPTTEPTNAVWGYGTQADWHWDALANCESGGRWNTVDRGTPAYDGGLGILRENWVHYGGLEFAPNAGLASREQQIIVGMRIYAEHGWDAWGCANNALNWPRWS